MHLLSNLIENLIVMFMTIVVLIGAIYALLLVLHYWLKFKSAGREEQGLTALWVDNVALEPDREEVISDTGQRTDNRNENETGRVRPPGS